MSKSIAFKKTFKNVQKKSAYELFCSPYLPDRHFFSGLKKPSGLKTNLKIRVKYARKTCESETWNEF